MTRPATDVAATWKASRQIKAQHAETKGLLERSINYWEQAGRWVSGETGLREGHRDLRRRHALILSLAARRRFTPRLDADAAVTFRASRRRSEPPCRSTHGTPRSCRRGRSRNRLLV